MRNLVFSCLKENALQNPGAVSSKENSLQCKGCYFFYSVNQMQSVPEIGSVCQTCLIKLAQMFLK